jgi:hypothetical protein
VEALGKGFGIENGCERQSPKQYGYLLIARHIIGADVANL